MPTRKIGGSGSVFTLGGTTWVGDLEQCTISMEVKTAEGKGVTDTDDFPIATGRAMTIDGSLMVSGSVTLAGTVNSANPALSFSVNTGANTYGGTAVITKLDHKWSREDLQKYDITLKSQGTVSIT